MVDKVWKLRTLFQGKMVVDLVRSRDFNYLRIRLISFDQVNLYISINRKRREVNSLRIYTLFQLFREVFFIHLING